MARCQATGSHHPGGQRHAQRRVGAALGASRSDDPERFDLLLKLTNGGTATETRAVVIATDAGEVSRSTHRLEPGKTALVNASIPASARVRATLEPGDALSEDDAIVLDLAPLRRRRVAADPKCPGSLVAAVRTHPALALAPADASDVEAALDCGTRGAAGEVATIRVLGDRAPTRPAGALQWSSSVAESRRSGLDAERLQLAAQLQARPADAVLLAAGDEPVIVSRAGASKRSRRRWTSNRWPLTPGPEIPLLVNLMFEQLLGSRLLDELAITDRGPAAATVAPATWVDRRGAARRADGLAQPARRGVASARARPACAAVGNHRAGPAVGAIEQVRRGKVRVNVGGSRTLLALALQVTALVALVWPCSAARGSTHAASRGCWCSSTARRACRGSASATRPSRRSCAAPGGGCRRAATARVRRQAGGAPRKPWTPWPSSNPRRRTSRPRWKRHWRHMPWPRSTASSSSRTASRTWAMRRGRCAPCAKPGAAAVDRRRPPAAADARRRGTGAGPRGVRTAASGSPCSWRGRRPLRCASRPPRVRRVANTGREQRAGWRRPGDDRVRRPPQRRRSHRRGAGGSRYGTNARRVVGRRRHRRGAACGDPVCAGVERVPGAQPASRRLDVERRSCHAARRPGRRARRLPGGRPRRRRHRRCQPAILECAGGRREEPRPRADGAGWRAFVCARRVPGIDARVGAARAVRAGGPGSAGGHRVRRGQVRQHGPGQWRRRSLSAGPARSAGNRARPHRARFAGPRGLRRGAARADPTRPAPAGTLALERDWQASPNGGTKLAPALDAAIGELERSAGARRMLVLVTDGFIDDAPLAELARAAGSLSNRDDRVGRRAGRRRRRAGTIGRRGSGPGASRRPGRRVAARHAHRGSSAAGHGSSAARSPSSSDRRCRSRPEPGRIGQPSRPTPSPDPNPTPRWPCRVNVANR